MTDELDIDYPFVLFAIFGFALLGIFASAHILNFVEWIFSKVRRWQSVERADDQYTKEGESGE